MADADILFPSTLRKPETQTLWGVGNLEFFRMININEMRAIFQFFHNGWCWYSISVNTQKTRDPNIWGVSNLKFFHMIDINKIRGIFQFFHNGWHWYSISIDTRKTGDPNFGRGSVIWNFSIQSILTKWKPFFNCFIMADTDIPFPLTLGKLEMWIFCQFTFPNFSVGSVFAVTHPRFCLSIKAWLC